MVLKGTAESHATHTNWRNLMTEINVTITRDADGEYRVPAPDNSEAGSYYTDDKEDARGAAMMIYNDGVDGNVVCCRWRSVASHPIGEG